MNLDEVAAELRRRRGLGPLDTGILLGRRFWGAVIRPWLVLVVPTLVSVQLVVAFLIHPVLAIAVGWWLKPLFDRVTLHVISRGFFGNIPSTFDTVRTAAGQWVSWEAFKDLTWRRLSPARTMTMPIRVLEQMRGKDARERIKSLYGSSVRFGEQMGLLTMVGGFKWLFYLGMATLAVFLTPLGAGRGPQDLLFVLPFEGFQSMVAVEYLLFDASETLQIGLLVGATTVATTIVEPFFGSGGFGVYIQRRIEREGWDLELRFRRLAERVASSLDGRIGLWLAAALAAVVAATAAGPAPAQADEPVVVESDSRQDDGGQGIIETLEDDDSVDDLDEFFDDVEISPEVLDESSDVKLTPADPDQFDALDDHSPSDPEALIDRDAIPVDDPQAELDDQMNNSPFASRTETQREWVPIEDDEPDEPSESPEWLDDLVSDLTVPEGAMGLMSVLLRVLMWLAGIVVVGFILWKIYGYIRDRKGGQTTDDDRATRWKEELTEEGEEELQIPDEHVADEVRRIWAAGKQRRAVAVLLISSLLKFEQRRNFRFPVGWTTTRCAREVRDVEPEGPILTAVAHTFSALAWAGQPPDDDQFQQLVDAWERAYEPRGGPS